jgi:2-polyprenyl-3-methyl-5-hydroxy-6-metoxy-1,4-benzoquinol methylase
MITVSREKWKRDAQAGELDWWMKNPWSDKDQRAFATKLWLSFGLKHHDFMGKTIVDVGCGPTVQSAWFAGARLVGVDPLANEFRSKVTWNHLDQLSELYAQPGEVLIRELVGTADAVVSINALDHAYDLGACLWNIAAYMKPTAAAYLHIDLHPGWGNRCHPLQMSRLEVERAFNQNGLGIDWHRAGESHGDGEGHKWILRKAA